MGVIYLRTKSSVCLKSFQSTDVNTIFDVFTDDLGLPYISIYAILNEQIEMPKGISINLGQIKNYAVIRYGVNSIINAAGISPKIVSQLYTDYYETKDGFSARALKPGLLFQANIELPEDKREKFDKDLAQIHNIGYINEDILGEVELYVDWSESQKEKNKVKKVEVLDKDYVELEYVIETITPVCIYTPYDYKSTSKTYITGEAIYRALHENYGCEMEELLDDNELIFSNAYPQSSGKRGMPVPTCMSIEKLEKNNLHYRLAPTPENFDSVQTVSVDGFLIEPGARTVKYFKNNMVNIYPLLIEEQNLSNTTRRDAIENGNMFRGYIRGKCNTIKKIAEIIQKMGGSIKIGAYQKEGFGEIIMSVSNLVEKSNSYELLAREFDVYCMSPIITYNNSGMNVYSAESLLKEIEKKLNMDDRLLIVKNYTDSEIYQSIDSNFKETDSLLKCIKIGSSLRIKTKNNEPIDISLLNNSFIGDYNIYGFGEIVTVPAYKDYYINALEVDFDKYELSMPSTITELQGCAEIIKRIARSLLDLRISFLAFNDRDDVKADIEPPMFILEKLRDQYDSSMTNEELIEKYVRFLKNDD